ncbi:hypothetical protein DPMN_157621 [Dreissena polymorpha]|uniref:Uncharacterized protein n=1 Tax=Dreissena polymorpha TaxID=45954 RepID=A0A9D4EFS5_DREPO|nr:hypothetical protein DPMN_157621 [Dreissena polymorpha]
MCPLSVCSEVANRPFHNLVITHLSPLNTLRVRHYTTAKGGTLQFFTNRLLAAGVGALSVLTANTTSTPEIIQNISSVLLGVCLPENTWIAMVHPLAVYFYHGKSANLGV